MDLQNVLAALGDPVRFRIVEALREQPLCVSDLVEHLGESQPNVSRHLKTLRASGIVDSVREGKWVRYRVLPEALGELARWASGPARPADPKPPERKPEPAPVRRRDDPNRILFGR
ncbi:MAG: winged helix-turn-helix transcriptional regulator [Candidatus Eisenbacteria bacterium]|nr:winged helix-turn-helix transcriptional regulator [Candidatus Eisenbacteria bacterium]